MRRGCGQPLGQRRAQRQNGGAKPTFARAAGDGCLDLIALRQEIERAQAVGEAAGVSATDRREWREYRDGLEVALDARLKLLSRAAESHDRAISGKATELCREYEHGDPSFGQLCRVRCPGGGPEAA